MTESNLNPESKKRRITSHDFITQWPLYSVAEVGEFAAPERISFHCRGCSKETTWSLLYHPEGVAKDSPDAGIKSISYRCGLCEKESLTVIYKELDLEPLTFENGFIPPPQYRMMVPTKLLKIGQHPALRVAISKELEKMLGDDAGDLYKKGMMSRNNGYGLGAIAYIRRIIEDKTDELIGVAAALAESHTANSATVSSMRDLLVGYKPYHEKLKLAGTVFPASLEIEGFNPLKSLHGLVSKGIHELSEEECLRIYDETREVFEYIFRNLRAATDDRNAFVEKMKKLSTR